MGRDAVEAAAGAIEGGEAIPTLNEAIDDATHSAPRHVKLRGNLCDGHFDAREVFEGAEPMVEDSFLVSHWP